ncbi:unnamed protein product [Protopolystoma xenopodis]|uniref:RED-like N-terminal domain-containing protein n=1 Tax=Protopolystoma xenopodis TaxID=117903 RepID=A0A3S5CQB5_9PLAT|nr:unnamed protein product [Protopolystoma xenopodis]
MEFSKYATNPMAPDNSINIKDTPIPQLSNSDFRRLLMTPRAPITHSYSSAAAEASVNAEDRDAEEGQDNRRRPYAGAFASGGSSSQHSKSKAVGHSGGHRRHQRPQVRQRGDTKGRPPVAEEPPVVGGGGAGASGEIIDSERRPRYRDRARERREGKLTVREADGEDDEPAEILGRDAEADEEALRRTADYRTVAPTADAGASHAERRKLLIQESKYLGGDMEHTHLVKGLDYVLLQKVRLEIQNKEREVDQLLDVELDKPEKPVISVAEPPVGLIGKKAGEQMQFKTRLAQSIIETLFGQSLPLRNEYFQSGRMAYRVELEDEFADSEVPTTVIRSKSDCPFLQSHAAGGITTTEIVINKLTQILSYLRAGKRQAKKAKMKGRLGGKEEPLSAELGKAKKLPGKLYLITRLNTCLELYHPGSSS